MTADLTPWFDVKTKPARIGVYEVRYAPAMSTVRRYFNGRQWETEYKGGHCLFGKGDTRGEMWRGLAADPAGGAK